MLGAPPGVLSMTATLQVAAVFAQGRRTPMESPDDVTPRTARGRWRPDARRPNRRPSPDGAADAWLTDPDGYRIELCAGRRTPAGMAAAEWGAERPLYHAAPRRLEAGPGDPGRR